MMEHLYPIETIKENKLSFNPFYNFYYLNFCSFSRRLNFYSLWTLQEITLNASGLSYNNEQNNYSRHVNIAPLKIELTLSPREKIQVILI